MYTIDLRSEMDYTGIDPRALRRLAARALGAEAVAEPAELSVLLTGDAAIRELNRTYRASDASTDVLSFAQSDGDAFAQPEDAAPHLGDVVISIDTARRQAEKHSLTPQDEVGHLLVHGILHLLGHDHERAAEARRMRAREDAILGTAHHH